jgi:hypothetical protein
LGFLPTTTPAFDESCWQLRFEEELSINAIAKIKRVSRNVVHGAIRRHHRRTFNEDPPHERLGRNAECQRRMAKAYRLINDGTICASDSPERVRELTGYANWGRAYEAAMAYRKATDRARPREDWGILYVRRLRDTVRLVVATKPLRRAGWKPRERIRWTIMGGTIRLEQLTCEYVPSVYVTPGDNGSEAYFLRFHEDRPWDEVGNALEMTGLQARECARRFAEQHEYPFYEKGDGARTVGVVRVSETTKQKKRQQLALSLQHAIQLLGWRPGQQVRWDFDKKRGAITLKLVAPPSSPGIE